MFDHTSRYYSLDSGTLTRADGTTVSYVRRRFVPQADDLTLLAEVVVQQGERIDLLAYRTLGDPLLFWRICDGNNAMDPREITEEPGRQVRVPLPQTDV